MASLEKNEKENGLWTDGQTKRVTTLVLELHIRSLKLAGLRICSKIGQFWAEISWDLVNFGLNISSETKV
jgi:hypothetical protein